MFKNKAQPPEKLSHKQRAKIFDSTVNKVKKEYFDPKFNGTEWPSLAEQVRGNIIACEDPEQFELAMHDLVRKLGTSHTGFFHRSVKRVPGRLAIGATFTRLETDAGREWIIQDVHPGGPADLAGLKKLDVIVAIANKPLPLDIQPMFPMGTSVPLSIRRQSDEVEAMVSIPAPRSHKQPYSEPQAVSWRLLPGSIGYLRVSILPGLLGLDVAREIDRAISNLCNCDRLVIDLRGHLGGGLAVLRLMSHLTPGKLPIGYTLTRKRVELGFDKTKLPVLDKLPTHLSNGLAVATIAARFARRDLSLRLLSEGLGRQKWHGRIAILVNEHTVSAGEMVAAFAAENRLAKLVGTETAGRLIPGSGFSVGHGYMLIIPRAAYITWQDRRFEGRGVCPDVTVPWSADAATTERDNQLETATATLQEM